MKKFLLLSISVCAALTMSAQMRNASIEGLQVQKAPVGMKNLGATATYADAAMKSLNISNRSFKKAKAKLPEAGDIYGSYVMDSSNEGDGTISFTQSSPLMLMEANEVDPETGDVYNVEITGIFGDLSDVLGVYDEETGLITIPYQYCYQHPTYGMLSLLGVASFEETENGTTFQLSDAFVLQMEEDENGFYLVPADGCIGCALYFEEGQYANSLADVCYSDIMINPANYIVTGESKNMLQGGAWEDSDDYGVFLEMIDEESLFIHGFMGYGTVEAKFDIDGNGTIETYQPLLYEMVSQDGEMDYIGPVAWDLDGENIRVNNDREAIKCGFYTFTYQESGEQVEAFALYDPDVEYDYNGETRKGSFEYYSLGRRGMTGGYSPLVVGTMMVPNPEFGTGIKDVQLTPVKKGTFNLAGQRVAKAKGVVIEDGKKVIR